MSAQGANLIKELHEVLNRFFNWLIAVIVLMSTEYGKALFIANYPVMMGLVAATSAYFLACVAATILQRQITNFLLIIMILLLQCVISVLALRFISFAISFTALALWLCIMGLIGFCKRQELYELIPSNLKRSNEEGNPQSPPLPESDITQRLPSPEGDIPQSRLLQETGSELSLESEIPRSPTSPASDGIVSPPLLACNSPQSPQLPESDNSDLPPV